MKIRKFPASAALSLSIVIVSAASGAQDLAFEPGSWEIRREMTGGPRQQQPQTERYCFTEAQLKADPAAPLKTQPEPGDGRKGPKCTIGVPDMTGGRASLSTTCKGPMGSIKVTSSGTYSATSFRMNGTVKMGQMSAKITTTARHLGACTTR